MNAGRHVDVVRSGTLLNGGIDHLTFVLVHAPKMPPCSEGIFGILQVLLKHIAIAAESASAEDNGLGVDRVFGSVDVASGFYASHLVARIVENQFVCLRFEKILAAERFEIGDDAVVVLPY